MKKGKPNPRKAREAAPKPIFKARLLRAYTEAGKAFVCYSPSGTDRVEVFCVDDRRDEWVDKYNAAKGDPEGEDVIGMKRAASQIDIFDDLANQIKAGLSIDHFFESTNAIELFDATREVLKDSNELNITVREAARRFLSRHTIKGKPGYTVEKLEDNVAKLRAK